MSDKIILTCGHEYTTDFPVEPHVSKAHCKECNELVMMLKLCDLPSDQKCGNEECERIRRLVKDIIS